MLRASFGSADTADAPITKKVVDRCAWLNARSCRRHSEFYSMIGALRGHTNELHPR
jgi:hypothetical protein